MTWGVLVLRSSDGSNPHVRSCGRVVMATWDVHLSPSLSISLDLCLSPCVPHKHGGRRGRGRRDAAWGDGRARGWERVGERGGHRGGMVAMDGDARVQQVGRRDKE